ncbi:NUDIX hydrolase [Enemella evansiae]|uniref:NUDIX hydrolase n=1 Tax=Enemella evansiae TaxID=2016499 RepID=UPI000B9716FB|nr:NUDIX domain-containing protein [Enemella evansiae]PFG68261.1 ADP-ribose pyrophosphatase YjhB (NUDIX family) [Propionibacteriaceae bacterium ES.041]OYO00992.1 DNA mismatch repair protein MutT [Enemella evansiae]OYO03101.1 DNA mismatch repair protein MutT [Enemella evansiae]OYO03785.1 DNA mismatch repair protein MutT [Enemella evansiae]OYO08073.1 DNA mismatch repair protein MutT [Enemella evansiae]
MRIVCVSTPGGRELFASDLGHGEDPHVAVWQHGLSLTRPLSATRDGEEIVLTVQGAPHSHGQVRLRRPRGLDPDLHTEPGEVPQVRQRVAAYGIVTSPRGLLATQFSDRTHVPGQWGLPGGGVDPGEEPPRTVVREAWEESGQRIEIGDLVAVQSDHWIGRAPNGTLEDFHAVRLVYAGTCAEPTDPVVHDVGGTTSAAQWVDLAAWRRVWWTAGARSLLDKNL